MKHRLSILILLFITLISGRSNYILSQETIVNVPFDQPDELTVEAGTNIPLPAGSFADVGADLQITGGSPGYNFSWVDPVNVSFFDSIISTNLPGMYHLYVYDEANCSDSDSLLVYAITSTDNEPEPLVGLFPNPSTGKIHYSVTGDGGKVKLALISSAGNILKELKDAEAPGILDLEIFPAGIYLLRIGTARHTIVREILLK